MRTSRIASRGADGRGPRLRRPDGSIDTGMPITSRRARTRGAAVVRRPPGPGNEAPEATGGGPKTLDAISVSSFLSAPSGKTYGTGRRRRRVNAVIHELAAGPVESYPRTSSTLWTSVWTRRSGLWAADGAALSRPSRTSRPWAATTSSRRRGRAQLRVPVVAARPDALDERGQRLVRGPAPEDLADVGPVDREQARVELAVGRQPGPRAVAAERHGDRRDDPELAARRRHSASGRRPRRGTPRSAGSTGQFAPIRSTSSAAGTTSSSRQPFECPTSMYSMKRRMTPVSRAQAAIGTMLDSLIPRRTTMLTLTGARPASIAAAIPSSTRSTGKSIPFIAPKTASSSESRLTVTRRSPASASGPRQGPQRRAVGGEGQVDLAAVGSAQRGQHRDEVRQVAPDERLAAGDPELLDAERRRRSARPARSPRSERTWSLGRNS